MFEFNQEDLKYNKHRQLSPRQKEWLKTIGQGGVRVQNWNVWIVVGLMFFGLCIILGLYLQNEDSRAALFANPLNLLIFPVIIIVVLGILILSILLARWNSNKLTNAVLSSVSGPMRCDYDSSGRSGLTSYYVFVGKKRFSVGEDMSSTFKERDKYKFYYCKAGMYEFVMSYEKLNG